MTRFGKRLRALREAKSQSDPEFSLRKVAARVGISPTFLSRVETGQEEHFPSEEVICRLAEILGDNPDVLLSLAGRIHSRLLAKIEARPEVFAALIETFDALSTEDIMRRVRKVRDGEW